MADEFLGQIRKAGVWVDYARGGKQSSFAWAAADTANRRVVDWIDKERVLYPEPAPPRQDADGNAYLAYFVPGGGFFAWSGQPGEPIEVAYAESGEPVDARFRPHIDPRLARALVAEFKRECDEHLTHKED